MDLLKPSNLIDLGGNGHRGGATETTVEELRDAPLEVITNLGVFWEAFSDGRMYWRTMGPTTIEASSAPGTQAAASSRLLLVWNRPFPEGKMEHTRLPAEP